MTFREHLPRDALLDALKFALVRLLASVNEKCEVIRVVRSTRVNNLFIESALCKVAYSGFNKIFSKSPQPNPRKLRKGLYIADLITVTKHISVILKLPNVAKLTLPDNESRARQVGEVITTFLKDTDYSEGQCHLRNLLTRFYVLIKLPGDPLRSTTLVQHHISLKPDTTPVYILANT